MFAELRMRRRGLPKLHDCSVSLFKLTLVDLAEFPDDRQSAFIRVFQFNVVKWFECFFKNSGKLLDKAVNVFEFPNICRIVIQSVAVVLENADVVNNSPEFLREFCNFVVVWSVCSSNRLQQIMIANRTVKIHRLLNRRIKPCEKHIADD